MMVQGKAESISSWQKITYSSGNFSVNLMAQMFATYAVFYYVDQLGVRPAWISFAMVIHGIFNAVMNPLFGHISDRTHSRRGRRKPYILLGMLPLAAVFMLIWTPFAAGAPFLFWYFLVVVLLYDLLFVMVVLNWTALFPEMFVTLRERASASAWRQMLGILGMIVGVAIPPMIYSGMGWGNMGLLFGTVVLLFFGLSYIGSKERAEVKVVSFPMREAVGFTFKNKAFMTFVVGSFFVQFCFALLPAAIPFFTKYVLHREESQNTILLGTIFVVAIPLVYVWGKWIAKAGARRIALLATGLFALAMAPFIWIDKLWSAIAAAAGLGLVLAGLLVLLDVMLAEVIDEDERQTGERREGMYFGMNGFIVRFGVSLQAIVMGAALEWSGYAANAAAQPDSVATGIRWMLSGIPMLSLVLAWLCFYLYPLRKRT